MVTWFLISEQGAIFLGAMLQQVRGQREISQWQGRGDLSPRGGSGGGTFLARKVLSSFPPSFY